MAERKEKNNFFFLSIALRNFCMQRKRYPELAKSIFANPSCECCGKQLNGRKNFKEDLRRSIFHVHLLL
jgi:hypothetical protein